MLIRSALALLLMALNALPAAAAPPSPETLAHADDYVFGYYPNGWRGRTSDDSIVFGIQTSSYALQLNASKAVISSSGKCAKVASEDAARVSNAALAATLAPTPLTFELRVGDTVFDAVSGAPKPDDVIIRRLGKYLVNVEVRGIQFKALEGAQPAGLRGSLILYCWPDHANVQLQVTADSAFENLALAARYTAQDGLRLQNTSPGSQVLQQVEFTTVVSGHPASLAPGKTANLQLALAPSENNHFDAERQLTVHATGIAPYTNALEVVDDPNAGWHQIVLGPNSDIWTMERVKIEIENPTEQPATLHLAFSKRGGGFGITGMSPVLCDSDGLPLGLPVQISKNWHVSPAWFDGITVLDVAAKSKQQFEFRLAYAQWGGVPAVAHAQLCLEGWGTHQLWDQMAIGSFGESICYDPDINLNRSMVDDMRPLMVWGMGNAPATKWSWTHNVGGADFLVLEQEGKRQFLSRQKTDYIAQGPVLSVVRYTGETPDGALQSQITTRSWRSDDYVRGLYTIRYDVTKPLPFSRLAFFQFAADHYNTNIFSTISRGNVSGVQETFQPEMGGKKYIRAASPLEGEKPWFALTGAQKNPPPLVKEGDQGAWANRGLIVHRWSAQLGGKVAPPHYAIYGTMNGIPSAVIELSAPPDVAQLVPGDFVDVDVEVLILPQRADDYYGPNEALRTALRDHNDDWSLVHREAVGTNLQVIAQTGRVESQWPVVVRADNNSAVFTIQGGIGYTPVTIVGARQLGPSLLEMKQGESTTRIDQASSVGNDWWQCKYDTRDSSYALTYTIPLDDASATSVLRTLSWSQK